MIEDQWFRKQKAQWQTAEEMFATEFGEDLLGFEVECVDVQLGTARKFLQASVRRSHSLGVTVSFYCECDNSLERVSEMSAEDQDECAEELPALWAHASQIVASKKAAMARKESKLDVFLREKLADALQ